MSSSTLFESFLKINKHRNNSILSAKKTLLVVFSLLFFSLYGSSQLMPCNDGSVTTNFLNPTTDIKMPECPLENGSITIAVGNSDNSPLIYTAELYYAPTSFGPLVKVQGPFTGNTAPTFTFSGLKPGYYCILIINEVTGKCAQRDIPLFCSPCFFDATLTAPPLTCVNPTTSITVMPTSGVGFLQFSLNGGPFQESNVFLNVGAGNYTVTVRNTFDHPLTPQYPPYTCDKDFPITIAPPANCNTNVCTYTQGYYGNASGKSCDGDGNKISTTQQIINGLNAWGGTMMLGNATRNVTVSVSEVAKVIAYLPGGESSYSFTHNGTMMLSSNTFKNTYLDNSKKRINSQLLGQTLVLGLNLKGMNSSLWNVPFNDNTKSYSIHISTAVYNALTTKNVGGLWQLANEALAGNVPAGLTLSMISDAVDKVNNAYNGCITINGNSASTFSCDDDNDGGGKGKNKNNVAANNATEENFGAISTKLAVTASPNPYRDNVRFIIETNISGRAVLEVYNVLGMKVATAFEGNMLAGQTQVVNYKATPVKGGGLYYVLRIGDQQVTGKLISAQQ